MLQEYPVTLTKDGNSIVVEFPDVPEALTIGSDENNALIWAQDALVVALSGYLDDRRDIPPPSKPSTKQKAIALPPLVASKLAIYQAMRDQGITQANLAEKLHCDARHIRRLLDLDHQSRLDLINEALHVLGKKLVIDIQPLIVAKKIAHERERY